MKGITQQLKKVNDTYNLDDIVIDKVVSILQEYNFPNNNTQRRQLIRAIIAHRFRFSKQEINVILLELANRGMLEQNCKGIKLYLEGKLREVRVNC